MNHYIAIPVAILGLLVLSACSSHRTVETPACVFPDAPSDRAPAWVCDEPIEEVALSAVGSAIKSAAGHDFMKQQAAASARVQLAQIFEVHVTNLIKQYAETTGAAEGETVDKVNTSITKQLTNQKLQGTKIIKTLTSPNGALYVLVGMDSDTTQQAVESALKSSFNNDNAAWQQFRAQQGFDELASDIAKQQRP